MTTKNRHALLLILFILSFFPSVDSRVDPQSGIIRTLHIGKAYLRPYAPGPTFVKDDTPWAHLDIAGVTWSSKPLPTVPKGGTGFGVRLLDRLVKDHYEA